MGGMGPWTAIVLAGQRPGENAFPAAHGVPAKALIPVGGEPMLARVVRALLASPSVARIVILAQEPEALLVDALAPLAEEPRIATVRGGAGISSSIAAVAGTAAAPHPVLVTTADHALLEPAIVEAFLAAAGECDAAFAMVERAVVERAYPETKRTWIKFSDGHYTGANLFAFVTAESVRGLEFWARVEKDRKKALKLLSFFGPLLFVRAFTRTISLGAAAAKAGRQLGLRIKAVKLPYANAAIDVDKPADLELVERILATK